MSTNIDDYIAKLVAGAPPLTEEQKVQIQALFGGIDASPSER